MKFLILLLLMMSQAYGQFGSSATIEEVESFVQNNRIGSVEGFLDALSEDLKRQYVLMYHSKSLQSASYQKPRVIMFSKTGEILFTFNGDSKEKNGNKIEIILFDRKSSSFRAHEIEFTGKNAVVKKDPQVCMSCHGTDLRPNWNHYNFWEGAYGSHDGELRGDEYLEMDQFKQTYSTHPRYKHLGDVPDKFSVMRGGRIKGLDIFTLTQLALNLNFQRIKRIVKANPEYDRVKHPFLSLFGMCDPKVYQNLLPKGYFEKIHPGFKPSTAEYDFDRESENDLKRKQLLNAIGIDTTFLTTQFGNTDSPGLGDSMFKSEFTTPGTYQFEFVHIMSSDDPDLKALTTPPEFDRPDKDRLSILSCDRIQKMSSKVANLKLTPVKPVLDLGKQVLEETCLKCHSNDALAGFPFTEEALSRELKSKPELIEKFRYRLDIATDESERMPLNMEISPEERRAIQTYIEKFAN